jgi:hypothetical protein
MAVGFFMGIRPSYVENTRFLAEAYIYSINNVLATQGLPKYVELVDPPNVYDGTLFGRSALDHEGGRLLAQLGRLARERVDAKHLALLEENPYRVAFVPIVFPEPLLTDFKEAIAGEKTRIAVGSLHPLMREVLDVAEVLNIPLRDGVLSDDTAARIRQSEPLVAGDAPDPNNDHRTTWLVVHEGVRLAISNNVALSLAG